MGDMVEAMLQDQRDSAATEYHSNYTMLLANS
jgi:hypothetical protein